VHAPMAVTVNEIILILLSALNSRFHQKKGGELVNFFQKEGNRPTEELLREQIPLLLYNQGEGRNVTRSDYLKWKYRNKPHVSRMLSTSFHFASLLGRCAAIDVALTSPGGCPHQ
jgi:hypothetical protein